MSSCSNFPLSPPNFFAFTLLHLLVLHRDTRVLTYGLKIKSENVNAINIIGLQHREPMVTKLFRFWIESYTRKKYSYHVALPLQYVNFKVESAMNCVLGWIAENQENYHRISKSIWITLQWRHFYHSHQWPDPVKVTTLKGRLLLLCSLVKKKKK